MNALRLSALPARRALVSVALVLLAGSALSTPVVISTPFMNLENRAVNSIGITPGEFIRFGANSVVPNGDAGTSGLAIQDGTGLQRVIPFAPFPLATNWFSRYLVDDPSLRGTWTLRFSNGADVSTARVNADAAAQQAKFVESITLSGTAENPAFTWTPSPGSTVNAYRVNFYEKTGNGTNSNLLAIARAYADFTPKLGDSPIVNLPVVLDNGAFKFNIAVVPNQVYYIDPEIAIGYDYAIRAGDPNFASVLLPMGIGDNLFDIFGLDDQGLETLLAEDWQAGQTFDFGAGGIARFRVTGIEISAGLDPGSTTAFVTGLTFTGAGKFTGTQTPITAFVNDVPEPSVLALVGVALAVLGISRRRSASLPLRA